MDPALLAQDLENALSALPGGVLVTFGATTVRGNLQRQSKVFQDGEGRIRSPGHLVELRIVTDALPGLAIDSQLTTAPLPPSTGPSSTWKIREAMDEPEGTTLLELMKP